MAKQNNYALLDYDGFICKSFFAGDGEYDKCYDILTRLSDAAEMKAYRYFNDECKIIKVVSGHCWKKDLYDTYKQTREKNPYVGAYRDFVIEQDQDILKPKSLEADELILMCHDYAVNIGDSVIVFSDDKDILYTTLANCKINLTEEINISYDEHHLYSQMLAGDAEDNVEGIYKVGMKTADKLLKDNGFDIYGVIKTYIDKRVTKEDCLKNINLIVPMKREFNAKLKAYDLIAEQALTNNEVNENLMGDVQKGQLEFLQNKIQEVYK